MNTTVQRIKTSRLQHRMAALTLILATANLWAQQPTEDSATPATQIPTQAPPTPASATETPTPAEPAVATDLEEAAADGPVGASSPFDYRASEKISEDLSVSFPVDI